MNRKVLYIIVISLFLSVSLYFFLFRNSRDKELRNEGDKIIAKVEKFRSFNNKLPVSLTEIGFDVKMEGPIYYERLDSFKYILWFGNTVGESVTYSSITKKWE